MIKHSSPGPFPAGANNKLNGIEDMNMVIGIEGLLWGKVDWMFANIDLKNKVTKTMNTCVYELRLSLEAGKRSSGDQSEPRLSKKYNTNARIPVYRTRNKTKERKRNAKSTRS